MIEQELGTLVMQAKAGDSAAMTEIIRRFTPLEINLIKKYFGSGIDWDDYLSEGDMLIIESVYDYDEGKKVPFESYLKIKLNYLYMNIRKKKKQLVYLDKETADGITLADTLRADDPPVDEPIIGREEYGEVRKAVKSLTHKQRTMIELYYYQGKSIKQCAEVMGIAYQSAVELKGRAIKMLADELKIIKSLP